MVDRREAAMRAKRRVMRGISPFQWPRKLLVQEVQRLVRFATPAPIRASLRRLEEAGLVSLAPSAVRFATEPTSLAELLSTEVERMLQRIHARRCVRERTITFPRRMLRFLAAGGCPSMQATVLAHLMRCVWRKGMSISNVGWCASSFVNEVFGVDPRNIKRARATLRELGWLASLPSSEADGKQHTAWAAVNLAWSPPSTSRLASKDQRSVDSPPRNWVVSVVSPLPISKQYLPLGLKDQYTPTIRLTGVRKRTEGIARPRLSDVRAKDLRSPRRLRILFDQAVVRGWVRDSIAGRTQFVTAAVHALRVATRNPAGLFVTVLRKGLWAYLTQADEDTARSLLADAMWHPDSGGIGDSRPNQWPVIAGDSMTTTVRSGASVDGMVRELSRQWSIDRGAPTAIRLRNKNAPPYRPCVLGSESIRQGNQARGSAISLSGNYSDRPAARQFPTEVGAIIPSSGSEHSSANGLRLGTRSALARPDSRSELGGGRLGEPKAGPADGIGEA